MDPLNKIILSLAVKKFNTDTAVDEDTIVNLANDLARDAALESPVTEDGKKIREEAKGILSKGGIESPFMQKKGFDMKPLYDSTVTASIKPIFDIIAKYAGPELGRPLTKPTKESDEKLLKINNDMTIEIFKVLNQNKVPLVWYAELMNDLKAIVGDIDSLMKRQVIGHTKEILSRAVGVRHPDPVNNGFNNNFATYEDLLKAREKMIEQTGGKIDDYKQDYTDEI